jgi:protein-S-isoprenylcysteine O-methyltransferase Ste14
MTENIENQTRSKSVERIIIRAAVQFVFSIIFTGGLLFISAGSIRWPRAWFHLGLWIVTICVNLIVLLKMNPSILDARTKRRKFESRFDMFLMLFIMTPALVAVPIVAGLDAIRYQLLPIPFWTVLPAVLFHITGNAVILWSMVVNPYSEKTVRIQTERGHHVITTGPYAIVRHPIYTGFILFFLNVPLILGSGWAFVPVTVACVVLIIRTIFEDRFLQNNLPGYNDYAQKTRYKLLPGIW